MSKYRFKTRDEFIKEYGQNWRDVRSTFVPQMDYLLGKDIDSIHYWSFLNENNKLNLNDRFNIYIGGFSVSEQMIIEIKPVPNYNEKKILIYE